MPPPGCRTNMIIPNVNFEELSRGAPETRGRSLETPFGTLADWLEECVSHGGFSVRARLCWISNVGRDFLNVMELDQGLADAGLTLGLRASSGKRYGARWYHGFCLAGGGGVCLGRAKEAAKQTSEANLKSYLERAVDELAVNQKEYVWLAGELKKRKLSEKRWREHLMERVRQRGEKDRFAWSGMGKIDQGVRRARAHTLWEALGSMSRTAAASGNSMNWGAHLLDQLYVFTQPWLEQIRKEHETTRSRL